MFVRKAYDVKLCLQRQTFDVVSFANATLLTKSIAETHFENNAVREKIVIKIKMYYIVYEPNSLFRNFNFKMKYFDLNIDKVSNVVFLKLWFDVYMKLFLNVYQRYVEDIIRLADDTKLPAVFNKIEASNGLRLPCLFASGQTFSITLTCTQPQHFQVNATVIKL